MISSAIPETPIALSRGVCRLLDRKLASKIRLYKIPALHSVADYFIIATATSGVHLRALDVHVHKALKDWGFSFKKPTEGKDSQDWKIIDLGFAVIHLMDDNARRKYHLENVWSEAKTLSWRNSTTRHKSSAKK